MLTGAAGYIDAETGAGNINIKNGAGKFKATTGAGDIYIHLSSDIKGNSELRTGTGSIILYVPADAKVTINAIVKSFGWGENESGIVSDFPASGKGRNHSQQSYDINGGGPVINIYAALGSIQIKKIK